MKKRIVWKRGEKAHLSKWVGILPQNMSEILRGERGVSYVMALRLERGCKKIGMKDRSIVWQTWMTLSRGK